MRCGSVEAHRFFCLAWAGCRTICTAQLVGEAMARETEPSRNRPNPRRLHYRQLRQKT